jgi:hypothetical protein
MNWTVNNFVPSVYTAEMSCVHTDTGLVQAAVREAEHGVVCC